MIIQMLIYDRLNSCIKTFNSELVYEKEEDTVASPSF